MGFERKIGRAGLGLTILTVAATSDAAPAPEPLVVTRLSDPEVHLIATSGSDENRALDERISGFAKALAEAAAVEQQAVRAKCGSAAIKAATGAGRMAWEASCKYRRR